MGAAPVPGNQDFDSPPIVVAAGPTRGAKAKVWTVRKTKADVMPAKKRAPPKKKPTRVPKMDAIVESEEESDSSQILEDPESLDVGSEPKEDSQLKIEQLRKQLAELEANQESRNPLKRNQSRVEPDLGARPELSPPDRRGNPAEGRSLGTFNGKNRLGHFPGPLRDLQSTFRLVKVRTSLPFDERVDRVRGANCKRGGSHRNPRTHLGNVAESVRESAETRNVPR